MSKRAILYARVSGDDTHNESRNLNGQIKMGRDYAEKHGYEVIAALAEDDRGASGAAFELPQLKRILTMARKQEFDVMIVREIDRLSRNLAKQLIVEEELKRAGVEIEYVLGEYPDTAEGRLNKHIKATVAEYEREKITERVTRGRRLKVEAGNIMGHGRAPYGYRLETKDGKVVLVIFEEEAHWVRMIYRWYIGLDGDPLGPTAIAHRLSEAGILTTCDKDKRFAKIKGLGQWNPITIQAMLKNETYKGVWHYGKEARQEDYLLAVAVPAIVTPEVWEAAQKQRKSNRKKMRRDPEHEYLLRGRLTCGYCHFILSPHQGCSQNHKKLYYRCHTNDKGVHHCPHTAAVRADQADAAVWAWLREILSDSTLVEERLQRHRARQEAVNAPILERIAVIDHLIAVKNVQLERAAKDYMMSKKLQAILVKEAAQVETEIEGLEHERAELQDRIAQLSLTTEQIRTLEEYRAKLAEGLAEADESFEGRQKLVAVLDVRGEVTHDGKDKILDMTCRLDERKLFLSHTDLLSRTENNNLFFMITTRLVLPGGMVAAGSAATLTTADV